MKNLVVSLFAVAGLGAASASACVHCGIAAAHTTALSLASPFAAAALANPPATEAPKRAKPKTATQAYEAPNATLWVTPKDWKKSEEDLVPGSPIQLKHVDGNAYLAVISTEQFAPADEFIKQFVSGMGNEQEGVKITLRSSADVMVNSKKMKDILLDGDMSGTPFQYRGYVYAGTKGVVVVLAWTHADLYDELKPTIEQVLDGTIPK